MCIFMRIEKLNHDMIKVTLSGEDLVSFNINVERLSKDSVELHRFLFRIMDTIHEETGFNMYTGQVVVEARTTDDGMCLTISKIAQNEKKVTQTVVNGKKITAKINEKLKGKGTYYFDSFDDLCNAISVIDDDVHQYNSLYKYEQGYFYILDFENPCFKNDYDICKTISVLKEFSKADVTSRFRDVRAAEHGELITSGDELVNMADKIRLMNKN